AHSPRLHAPCESWGMDDVRRACTPHQGTRRRAVCRAVAYRWPWRFCPAPRWRVIMPLNTADVIGRTFRRVGTIDPQRNPDGSVKRSLPQDRYAKAASTSLHRYGHGPFCKFTLTGATVAG